MTAASHIDVHEYRVLAIDPLSGGVYACKEQTSYRLIRVGVRTDSRPAHELQTVLRRVWRLPVIVLDLMISTEDGTFCAVVELLQSVRVEEIVEIEPDQIPDEELSGRERGWFLSIVGGRAIHAISRVGWPHEAVRWVEMNTSSKVSSTAEIEQFNAGNGFSLLRFDLIDEKTYWLKATGTPNTHERSISSLLARLCPGFVPDVVAERTEWNAWLMSGNGHSLRTLPHEATALEQRLRIAVGSLAGLQIKTVGFETELLQAGVIDHRPRALRSETEALFDLIERAMSYQTSTKVTPIGSKRLSELKRIFEKTCGFVDDLGIPNTILQGDMNLDNILFAGEHCRFIDWSEGRIGNPLVTLEHLLLLNQLNDPALRSLCDTNLRNAYRAAMSSVCAATTIDVATPCAPLLAAASTILGRKDCLFTRERTDVQRLTWVRTIARHMDRAAQAPGLLRALRVSSDDVERT